MFNGKKKVRRTFVEKRILASTTGCPRRNFEKTAVYSQATKNNRFSSKIII